MKVEAITISDIRLSDKYPFVRFLYFKDRKYQVVLASNLDFSIGEEVVYIPDGVKLPPYLLKHLGLWDAKENKGMLFGKEGNVVRAYRFNSDLDHYSYGLIVKVPNGFIDTPHGPQDIHTENLENALQIKRNTPGLPNYFAGDLFLADIRIEKRVMPELECVYTEFLNDSDTTVESLLPGRIFYATITNTVADANALGIDHNIFITTGGLNKYSFYSRSRRNLRGNLFVKRFVETGIQDVMRSLLGVSYKRTYVTFELILKNTAFGNNNTEDAKKNQLLLNDVFFGEIPFSRYMNRTEKIKLCKMLGIEMAPELYVGPFDYDTVFDLAEKEKYGVVVRSDNCTKRAVLYNRQYRFKYLKPTE